MFQLQGWCRAHSRALGPTLSACSAPGFHLSRAFSLEEVLKNRNVLSPPLVLTVYKSERLAFRVKRRGRRWLSGAGRVSPAPTGAALLSPRVARTRGGPYAREQTLLGPGPLQTALWAWCWFEEGSGWLGLPSAPPFPSEKWG